MGSLKQHSRLIAVALAFLMAGTLCAPALVEAATNESAAGGFNLTVSPLPVNLATKPGQAVSTPIRIQNSGTKAVKLKVTLMKFAADGTTGSPALQDVTDKDAFMKWASLSKTSFVAEPNVSNTINMTIRPPTSAAFGYYYAVVFSQDNGTSAAVPNLNKVNGAVASLVLLDVQTGGEKRQLEVTRFSAGRKLYQYLPADFAVAVKNSGNIHVVPTGNVFIKRAGSDEIIGTLPINDEQGNVLPNSSRVFKTEWNDGFPSFKTKQQNGQTVSDASGQPQKELKWDLQDASNFRFGKYDASMTLVYSDGERDVPVNGELSFWVIPWVPLLIALLIIGLVLVGLYVLLKPVIKKARNLRKK